MTLLDQVFKGSDVKYDIDGYQISLKKVAGKTENPTEYAVKKRKVTGVVVDASNDEPLIGAPVYFDNKTNGVVTDIDGFFNRNTRRCTTAFLVCGLSSRDSNTRQIR